MISEFEAERYEREYEAQWQLEWLERDEDHQEGLCADYFDWWIRVTPGGAQMHDKAVEQRMGRRWDNDDENQLVNYWDDSDDDTWDRFDDLCDELYADVMYTHSRSQA